jgi:hypothetical protein
LNDAGVRYVVIGVWGANHYATSAGTVFRTEDRDLFLPSEPHNLLQCWEACAAAGLRLWGEREPLDQPVDRWLASTSEIRVDLTLVMQGFEFETVWNERRTFRIEGEDIPVARLLHIVTSKHAAGRDKDRLFLATHREALEELLRQEDSKKGP